MVTKIIWSKRAKIEFKDILQYWVTRNKSNTFSLKLSALMEDQLNLILKFPKIGRKTDVPNVYVKIVKSYFIFYEIIDQSLYVLSVRDGRRDPKTLNIR